MWSDLHYVEFQLFDLLVFIEVATQFSGNSTHDDKESVIHFTYCKFNYIHSSEFQLQLDKKLTSRLCCTKKRYRIHKNRTC